MFDNPFFWLYLIQVICTIALIYINAKQRALIDTMLALNDDALGLAENVIANGGTMCEADRAEREWEQRPDGDFWA